MTQDISKYDEDLAWLVASMAKWWKIPSEKEIDFFCERVAMLCQDDEIDENEARRIVFERIIFK